MAAISATTSAAETSEQLDTPFQFDIDSVSQPFVGRWYTLISTTNWEKGRIIREWRKKREAEGLDPSHYSDEAWAQMVGNVTSQHVGRLRRVAERFCEVHATYPKLYWSHFHAALDWDDAEMWLEGAVQDGWSVSAMREARRAVNKAPAEAYPAESDVIEQTIDSGDYHTADDDAFDLNAKATMGQVRDPDGDDRGNDKRGEVGEPHAAERSTDPPKPKARPLADLPELPEDLSEAFEQFKLAILHHKLGKWQDISRDDLLATLDALKALAMAPSEG